MYQYFFCISASNYPLPAMLTSSHIKKSLALLSDSIQVLTFALCLSGVTGLCLAFLLDC